MEGGPPLLCSPPRARPPPPIALSRPPNPPRSLRPPDRKSILMGGRGAFSAIGASAERRNKRLRARGLLRLRSRPRCVRSLSGFRVPLALRALLCRSRFGAMCGRRRALPLLPAPAAASAPPRSLVRCCSAPSSPCVSALVGAGLRLALPALRRCGSFRLSLCRGLRALGRLAFGIPFAPSRACLASGCGPRLRRFAWAGGLARAISAFAPAGARLPPGAPPLRLPALPLGLGLDQGLRGLGCAPAGALRRSLAPLRSRPAPVAAAAAGLGCAAAAAREENKGDFSPRPMVHSSYPSPGTSPQASPYAPAKERKR